MPARRLILDTNCFIEATKSDTANSAYELFVAQAAPRLYLSSVVAAELRAGAIGAGAMRGLEDDVFSPYLRRGRVLTPSTSAWGALGTTLATLVREDGLQLKATPRSFIFDILIAYSCREAGAILVSANLRDLNRIARIFAFDYVGPYPDLSTV